MGARHQDINCPVPGARTSVANERKKSRLERVALHLRFGSNGAQQHLERLLMSDKIVHITDESFENA